MKEQKNKKINILESLGAGMFLGGLVSLIINVESNLRLPIIIILLGIITYKDIRIRIM